MVKIRLQGTTNEIKRMRRVIERNRNLKVISVSDVFANKGTKKYILAALFNAPTTMGGYFRAEVNHDMPQLAKAR